MVASGWPRKALESAHDQLKVKATALRSRRSSDCSQVSDCSLCSQPDITRPASPRDSLVGSSRRGMQPEPAAGNTTRSAGEKRLETEEALPIAVARAGGSPRPGEFSETELPGSQSSETEEFPEGCRVPGSPRSDFEYRYLLP